MESSHLPIGVDLTRTGRIVAAAFDDTLADAGGSLGMWMVLMTLKRGGTRMQREIAESIGIEGATLTHHLNRMESAGLVTRERDPKNRRTHRVELTGDGSSLFHTLLERVIAFDAHLRAGLTAEDESTLRELLGKLRANVAGGNDAATKEATT